MTASNGSTSSPGSRLPARGRPVRAAAAAVVERALAARVPAESLLASEGARFDDRDRRLLAELAYGALRWKLRLEQVVAAASGRAWHTVEAPLRPVLLVGAYQLLWLDRIPAHAAVSEAVDEATRRRGRGAAGFVNAVLRKIAIAGGLEAWPVTATDTVTRLAIEHSHPPELVRRWLTRFGSEATTRILTADNGGRELSLLAFRDRGGRERLAAALAAEGVDCEAGRLAPESLRVVSGAPLATAAFARGDFYVQDEASQAAALVPPPAAGERILDVAAAPGGKGLALLAHEPTAQVVFADGSPARAARLAENARRLGRSLRVVATDARRDPWSARFDRVVVDAPCSGTGTLRRHPELRWRFHVAELARLARGGLEMLAASAPRVAPGGRLIHITCSIEPEENEEVVSRFLAAAPEFEDDPLTNLADAAADGRNAAGRWRVLPGDGHDGFTVAVLRRRM